MFLMKFLGKMAQRHYYKTNRFRPYLSLVKQQQQQKCSKMDVKFELRKCHRIQNCLNK